MEFLVNKINLSTQEKQSFLDHGFIKLKNLLTPAAMDQLKKLTSKKTKSSPKLYSGDFDKMGYDVQESITKNIYSSSNFQETIKQLAPKGVAFIQGIGFELKTHQKGFAWHHDLLSLCYVMPQDLAYTLWIPLDPIKTKKQHGGLAYVSRKIHSARGYFDMVYQLVQQEGIAEFAKTEAFKNWDFQYASEVEEFILDKNQVADDFEVGDALLLDKFVWHKSCPLQQGELPSRKAYVMRFIDRKARFSKILVEGTYTLLKATTNDLHSDVGDQLTKVLNEGDNIADHLMGLNQN